MHTSFTDSDVLGTFTETVELVRNEMEKSLEHQVGLAIQGVFASLDELIALAASPDTRDLVCAERVALGQMLTRCQTLCSFALANTPGPKVVINNG